MKKTLLTLSLIAAGAMSSQAALFTISNVGNGADDPNTAGNTGDALYTSPTNAVMASGFVAFGYFVGSITESQINTISGLQSTLLTPSNFITVTSASLIDTALPGYALGTQTSIGTVTIAPNPNAALIGRSIYSIITNQADLATFAAATLDDTVWVGLVNHGTIKDDVPNEGDYTSNPLAPAAPVIGTFGTVVVTDPAVALGEGNYQTMQLATVPEPSAALLGALGALGLLRRRRI